MVRKGGKLQEIHYKEVSFIHVIKGSLLALLIALIFCAVLGVVTFWYDISDFYVNIILKAAGLIGIFVGSIYAARRARGLGWLNGGLVGIIFIFLAVIVSSLTNPGQIVLMVVLSKLLIAAIIGAVSGIVALNI